MAKTYLKYIELAVDDFESQIINEINCSDDAYGRAKVEMLRKDAKLHGRASLVVSMQVSCAPALL